MTPPLFQPLIVLFFPNFPAFKLSFPAFSSFHFEEDFAPGENFCPPGKMFLLFNCFISCTFASATFKSSRWQDYKIQREIVSPEVTPPTAFELFQA